MSSHTRTSLAAAAVAVATSLFTFSAHADPVSTTGKGIAGGAMLGGEIVMMGEAAFGVKPGWAYLVGGGIGAIGGGVGGYFIERTDNAKVTMYMLTAGMALVIPTSIIVLSATSYEPPEDYQEDRPQPDEPVADPAGPAASTRGPARVAARRVHRRLPAAHLPPALVGMDPEGLRLSVPAVELRDVFSAEDSHQLGVARYTELRVPVLNFLF